jgi:hypothetical protein
MPPRRRIVTSLRVFAGLGKNSSHRMRPVPCEISVPEAQSRMGGHAPLFAAMIAVVRMSPRARETWVPDEERCTRRRWVWQDPAQWRLTRPDGSPWSDAPARLFDRLWNEACVRQSSAGRFAPAFDCPHHARSLNSSASRVASSVTPTGSLSLRGSCSAATAKRPLSQRSRCAMWFGPKLSH